MNEFTSTEDGAVTRTTTIAADSITDKERADALRWAIWRELGLSGMVTVVGKDADRDALTLSSWDEIKDKTLSDLVACNTDALCDDVFEYEPKGEDLAEALAAIRAGSAMLGFDYTVRI
jgi:hypothetical protein